MHKIILKVMCSLSGKDCPLISGLVAYDEFSSGWTKKRQKETMKQ